MRNRILIVLGVLLVVGFVLYFLGFKMSKADLHISAAAEPLACIGGQLEGEFCSADTILPITNAFITTILVDLVLALMIFVGARNMQLVPKGLQNLIEVVIEALYNFALGVDRKNVAKFFPLPATIFIFFLVGNLAGLLPGFGSIGACMPSEGEHGAAVVTVASLNSSPADAIAPIAAEGAAAEETLFTGWPASCADGRIVPWLRAPAADLNVTFAVAIVAVFMVEYYGFQALGFGYLGKFFINPFKEGAIMTFVGIIELFSEIMRIVAFAFRIFGNIFGGEVILVVMAFLFPYILPLPFYAFEVFVSFIQAVIFAVLTLVFFSLAVQEHGGHNDHDGSAVPAQGH